ncbi:MAG: 3-phosphoshikimate 1-carboxyvinyltransferase [Candidatus Hydrothermarchaeales archaeon]
MIVKIKKTENLEGVVDAPPSKSYTHRAIMIASLAEGRSIVRDYLKSGDTDSSINACRAFGVDIEEVRNHLIIRGSNGRLETPKGAIDVQNSGTTMRLACGLAALDGNATLTGDASIQKRPVQPLLDALGELGIRAYSTRGNGCPPVVVEGGTFRGGQGRIRGDVSSQFISSLLIVAPYAENDVEIILTTEAKSRPYIDLTLDIMERFGVPVQNENYRRFRVNSGQHFKGREYSVEGDYTSASYLLASAALTNSKITVGNLLKDSKQGDKVIMEILRDMGAKVERRDDTVTITGGELEGIDIDLGDTPDLLPTVVALASKAKGDTIIKNIRHARLKECDRVSACAEEFRKFGAEIEERKDCLIIRGTEKLKGSRVESYNDHRMAMALTIAGICAEGETIVKDAESVEISFPGFFQALMSLGAEIEV